MGFPLVPTSVMLNDLERRYGPLSHLLFFKNSCQTQLCAKFIHIYVQSNSMTVRRKR